MKEFLTTIRISRLSSDFSEVATLDYEETDVARSLNDFEQNKIVEHFNHWEDPDYFKTPEQKQFFDEWFADYIASPDDPYLKAEILSVEEVQYEDEKEAA
jgi:hypothetical protein